MRFFEMNNIFVYIEMEGGKVADVSLELLTKGRELATTLGVKLEAVVLGHNLAGIEKELAKYGADTVWVADDPLFSPFRTLPHTAVLCGLIGQEKPQIALFGATPVGRDFAPRVSSALHSGLTADCTQLEIGDHKDAKTGTEYKNLLYQIRPAFGGNIIATIVNPDHRPQMATVREGVMRKEYAAQPGAGEVKAIDWKKMVTDADLAVKIIDRQIEERKIDIKGAWVPKELQAGARTGRSCVAGGYGMGSKENFRLVHELADVLGGEVGASRAEIIRKMIDAGFTEHARQVGQTGVTVRPKLYIACGISGQIQHTAGMDQSSMVISINSDPEAPINKIADYAITGGDAEFQYPGDYPQDDRAVINKKYCTRPFGIDSFEAGKFIPLVFYGSMWFDAEHNLFCFCGENEIAPDLSGEIVGNIPHFYVIGIEFTPKQEPTNLKNN